MSTKPQYQVDVVRFSDLREIEGSWTAKDFTALLDRMDYGDVSGMTDAELREMCVLSLQDLKSRDAAVMLLDHRLGAHLTRGQVQNHASEMHDEKLWEQGSGMSLHEGFFHVASLLYAAFPRSFPVPDAIQLHLNVRPENEAAREQLEDSIHESFLLRLLSDGMEARATLHRLFSEQLSGDEFPEAESIVWIVISERLPADVWSIEVISSSYWLDPLRGTQSFTSSAYPDASE